MFAFQAPCLNSNLLGVIFMNKGAKIGVFTAAIVGINAMIGAGIFSAPATLASASGMVTIITYIFVIASVWFIALSLSRVAKLFPQEGSFYTYAKSWGGNYAGMIAAGAYVTGVLIAMGLLAQIAGGYLYEVVPIFSPVWMGLILLGILVILNMIGVKFSRTGQLVLVCTTIFPILATVVLCLTKMDFAYLASEKSVTLKGVLTATNSVIFSFFGFEAAASLFSVVRNPEKNVPRALTYSIFFVGVLYLIFVGAIVLAVPSSLFTHPKIPLSIVLVRVFPSMKGIVAFIHIAILSAITGTIHSMIWSSSTLIQTFSENAGKKLSIKSSVLFVGIFIALTGLIIKSVELFFNLTALFIVSAYSMAMVSLLLIEEEWKSRRNLITLFGLTTAAVMILVAINGIIQFF